jgi:uncharacterized membrane protein YdbT with pleckstrin-like domain
MSKDKKYLKIYSINMNYASRNLLPGEIIVFQTKRHWIIYILSAFILLLGIFFLLSEYRDMNILGFYLIMLLAAPCGLLTYLDIRTSEFVVTNKRVIAKVGVIRRHSLELLISKIEGLSVQQGILGRFFDYGTIVASGTGSTKNPFSFITQPLQLRRCVYEQIEKLDSKND